MHITTKALVCSLMTVPPTLGLKLKTDDAAIGFFRYGPTEDVWRFCRPGDARCEHNHGATSHRTSTPGAFVEFMTVATKLEYIGRVIASKDSPQESARVEFKVDDQVETITLDTTSPDAESRVLWTKAFNDGEQEGSKLKVVRITNLDGAEMELDYVSETMELHDCPQNDKTRRFPDSERRLRFQK